MALELGDGRVIRFGPDERDERYVPYHIEWATALPGGFGDASFVLSRPPDLRADDAMLFSSVRVYGPGGRTYYEGRVTGIPQVASEEVRFQTQGHAAALDDDKTFREVYVDIDLGHWTGDGSVNRDNLVGVGYTSFDGSVTPDGTLAMPMTGDWGAGNKPHGVARYQSPTPIGSSYYAWRGNPNLSTADATWVWSLLVAFDEVDTGYTDSGNLRTGPTTGTFTPTASARKLARASILNTAAGGTAGVEYTIYWTCLAVYGNHGLTKYGTASATEAQGFLGSDVVANVVGRMTDLTYSLGDSIQVSSFPIPHLVFREPVSAKQVIEQATALGGTLIADWGVYDDRTFFWRAPGTYGRTWRVRKDQVATPTSEGPESENRITGIVITYRDGAGIDHSVGPPGSGADYETAELVDTDPQNPANRLHRKWDHETVGITNQQNAVNIGIMLLNERNRIDWRGSTEIKGEATDSTGAKQPTALIRAGDQIVIEDELALWAPKKIVGTSYSQDDLTARVDIGAPAHSLEVLLGVVTAATDLLAA